MAKVEDIEIHTGIPDFAFQRVRSLEVKCEATNALMPAPTVEEANGRLRALAAKVGANAVIEVQYNSGISFTSWKSLKATGTAVIRESDERTCPSCAETVKRAAVKCRYCGFDLPPVEDGGREAQNSPEQAPSPMEEPLRDNNNPALIIGAIIIGFFILSLFLAAV